LKNNLHFLVSIHILKDWLLKLNLQKLPYLIHKISLMSLTLWHLTRLFEWGIQQ